LTVVARVLALVLALLLVGGVAQAYEAPAIEDLVAEVAPVVAPSLDAPPPRRAPPAIAPRDSAGRDHVASIDRPPRTGIA
jgi:hypothetical protein